MPRAAPSVVLSSLESLEKGAPRRGRTRGAGRTSEPAEGSPPERRGRREFWAARYTLALLGFLGLAVEYSLRVNLSIAIVAMAGTSEVSAATNTSLDVCPRYEDDARIEGKLIEGEFDWDEQTQGIILGSFFYGYTATNLLGGRAAEYLGGRLVFGLGTVISALISLLSPLCARLCKELFVASRVLMGISQGVTIPAFFSLMATWFPPEERAKFGPLIKGGMQFGTVVAMTAGGYLSASSFLGGWPSVFYVFGTVGLAWGIPWFLLVHDRPELHPSISRAELEYLRANKDTVKGAEVVSIPWRAIFTSPPVWACIFIAWGGSFGFQTLLSEIPTYLANIQHFDMRKSGFMAAVPYLCLWLFGVGWGFCVDGLFNAGVLSVVAVRRISAAFAHYGPAVALVVMCFVDCNSTLAMVVLCIAVGVCGSAYSGNALTEQDIAPNLTGTLVGITNTISAVMGFVAPSVTGAITQGRQGSLAAWRTVFAVCAANYAVTTTLYLLLVSAEVQPWNKPDEAQEAENGNKREREEGNSTRNT
ncbi:sialin [Penaeus vannamei]|uniref:Putative inorganic phosphate cotransporter n=1 Tax=Penaeus vannamei TaxID=6689 RepID=A0A3R7M540_PENVA|nr:sialin-like [Penaeus vannamei]ROT73124.1 putative inorganic phosphate cotransporter [Penaeus vannamei]